MEIRAYVEALGKVVEDVKRWEQFGRIGKPPMMPEVPPYLELYLEVRRWPGHLLVEGGLYDQPSWTWDMMDLAGQMYEDLMERKRKVEELADGV